MSPAGPPARRPAWALAGAAAAGLAAFAAVELPGRATRAALVAETRAAETALTKAPARAAEVEMLGADLAAARARLERTGGLSAATGPHATLARVADAADARGVTLTRLTPGPPQGRGTYREWPFAVSLEAPAPAFQAFLADLEADRPLAEVVSLTLAPATGAESAAPGAPTRLRGELAFVIYARPAAGG